MIKIGDQLFVNNKWYFDVIGIYGEDLLIQIFYMFGYPKQQITRKAFKINKNLIFIEKENDIYKYVSISENKLKTLIGTLIDQILIQADLDLSIVVKESIINEDGGVAVASAGTTTGMGAVVSPGSPTTPGVSGTAGSDTAIVTTSSNGFDFDRSLKKKKKTNEEFDFVKYNNSQKNKEIIDTRFSKKHIKELIAMGKVLNPKIQSTELNKTIPNSWKPVGVINYNENSSIEKMTEDEYKTNFLEFINRIKEDVIDSEISTELIANKEAFIKNPVVKIKDYLNRFYDANIDLFNTATKDFLNSYNLFR